MKSPAQLGTGTHDALRPACPTSSVTNCNRLVVTNCREPWEHILVLAWGNKFLQDSTNLLQLAGFWLFI